MRKLKFKAWDKTNKQWINDFRMILPASYKGEEYPIIHGGVNYLCVYVQNYEWEDCILCASTGLKDRNGKDIYEGDIIEYYVHTDEGLIKELLLVEWNEDSAYFNFKVVGVPLEDDEYLYDDLYKEDFSIIGNMYENPELIKGD